MTLNFLHLIQRPAALACLCFALSPETFAQSPAPSPVSLEVVVLGSGGPGATGRAGSSYLVLLDGVPRILVDAGPGSFARLGEAKMSLSRTDIVLLTHLHIDHVGDCLVCSRHAPCQAAVPSIFRYLVRTAGAAKATKRPFRPPAVGCSYCSISRVHSAIYATSRRR